MLLYASFFPRLIIFLLLPTSSNVYLCSDRIFSLSVCASNVTCKGRSVQCCTCSTWLHLGYTFFLPLSLTFSPSSTSGAVHPATSRPLLGLPSPATLSHFLRGSPAFILPLFTTIHSKPLTNAVLLTHLRLQTLQPSFFVANSSFCFFPSLLHFSNLHHFPFFHTPLLPLLICTGFFHIK